MPNNKKHHYIPIFYLKNFSSFCGKGINIFNLRSQKNILNGKLKNQCYENYFYGKDLTVEKALSDLEGLASHLLKEIIKKRKIPQERTEKHHILSTYIVIQYGRTKFTVEYFDEIADKFIKTLLQYQPDIDKETLSSVKIGFKDPVSLSLAASAQSVPIIMDLKLHLLINETPVKFITSDNPVVLHNQYCEGVDGLSTIGLSSQGLQIFLPISPDVLLILYDPLIYEISNKENCVTKLCDTADVTTINRLQGLNSLENIYYSDKEQADLIKREADFVLKHRNQSKAELNEYELESDDGYTHHLVYGHKPNLKIEFNSFIKIRKGKLSVPMQERINKARDPLLAKLVYNLWMQ